MGKLSFRKTLLCYVTVVVLKNQIPLRVEQRMPNLAAKYINVKDVEDRDELLSRLNGAYTGKVSTLTK